jgi:hypothetical protein
MAAAALRIEGLPASPLDASAYFHAKVLPEIRAAYAGQPEIDLIVVFDPAGHEHRAWRLAVIQELAREVAAAARGYLEAAKGVTGQLLALDGNGAGPVL